METWRAPALAVALVVWFAAVATAQIGRVSGTVKDEAGRPIRGAAVTAYNGEQTPSTYTVSTDEKGRFGMLGLRRGIWIFTIQAPGFETARLSSDIVTLRPNAPLEIRLLRGSLPAPPGPLAGISAKEIQQRLDSAESLVVSGDLDRAIAAYRELLARAPALTSIYLQIGALYERRQDRDSALEAYRQLVRLEPCNSQALAALERLARPQQR